MRTIWTSKNKMYRIVEHEDDSYDLDNLKGDMFNPKVNTSISEAQLKKEEIEFERLIEREGVYGYELEKWDSSPGVGWTHVDSCWGFVGQYDENDTSGIFKHYIVDEFITMSQKDSDRTSEVSK